MTMDIHDDTFSEEIPSRSSTSSSSTSDDSVASRGGGGGGALRPSSAPVAQGGFGGAHPPRSIRTAPAPSSTAEQNVRVVARVRPLSSKEIDEGSGESISAHSGLGTIRVLDSSGSADGDAGGAAADGKRKFEFDSVFGVDSTQKEVYERTCGDMISSSVFKGFNATILAYGQTGSGKTFTMGTDGSGGGGNLDNNYEQDEMAPPSSSEGIIARAVYDLFKTKQSLPNGHERVKVSMSYLEIYNEQAIDLLNDDPASAHATLQVRDSKTEGVVMPGLGQFVVDSPKEVRALMIKAGERRAVGSTHMNSASSRSHAICTLSVVIAPDNSGGGDGPEEGAEDGEQPIVSPRLSSQGMRAKLTLVDLAGSERIKRTGAEGARMKEGININKGLFVLGQVVSALSELGQQSGSNHNHHAHIPYRDSKLTRLLQDSLGGNSRTVMIACISPAASNVEESVNTLRYAERTRNIKNSAVRNVVAVGLSAVEAAALRRENQRLRLELAKMEATMAVGGGGSTGTTGARGFAFASSSHAAHGDTASAEIVSQLRAQCTSLLAENDLLKARARGHAEEVLEASLRADRWQVRSEAIARLAVERGVELPEEIKDGKDAPSSGNEGNLVGQLRSQLAECMAELLEARAEAAFARATAGAIMARKFDMANIDEMTIGDDEDALSAASPSKHDEERNERLTWELSAVSATIEQKEAMVLQMNKERACRDNLQQHFESSLRLLQAEVDCLAAERDELVAKMSSDESESNNNAANMNDATAQQQRRGKRKANDATTKKLREQISKLEERIDELKVKASEHKRSMRLKEEAEKKCARLMAEIAEDKRRRADLQRKLKEASAEVRAEKKAARNEAAKMMKDKQRLKIELSKMKSAADRQAAVLKRKIDQASAREKARVELERKRRSAEKTRAAGAASSASANNSDVREDRKTELASWIERELEHSLVRFQIEDQRCALEGAVKERRRLMKTSRDTVDVEELSQMDATIESLKATIQELEISARKAFQASSAADNQDGEVVSKAFRFLENDKYRNLSKPEAKYVLSYIFDACSSTKRELAISNDSLEEATSSAVESALAKKHKLHEKELAELRMEYAEEGLNLLESTQGIVNSHMKLKLEEDNAETKLKVQVGSILEDYNKNWSSVAESLKSDLEEIKDNQDDLQAMLDNVAKGMTFVPKKKVQPKKKVLEESYETDAFESEESFVEDVDGEDSEYEPTPAKKAKKNKRRSPRLAKKAATAQGSPSSPIGENFIEEIDKTTVGVLKKACRKLGVSMTGKKADLQRRVRETILSNSMALPNPAEEDTEEANDDSFDCGGSAVKRVNFEQSIDIAGLDPEFQPVEKSPSPAGSIKKKLWEETTKTADRASLASTEDDSTESPLPGTPPKMTPCKRKKRSPSAEKENPSAVVATPKRNKPLGFMTSSPRPLATHNRTPVHLKQTISTAKKRLVPDKKSALGITKRGNITASSKKRTKRGMADAVARALQQAGGDGANMP